MEIPASIPILTHPVAGRAKNMGGMLTVEAPTIIDPLVGAAVSRC
jgi:hypothetical protein